jgi:polysaccharide export outer membrane protein
MTTRQKIIGDGTISVGLIGRVPVAGLNINEASKKIAALLNEKQLVNPQVTISVEAYDPRRFTVWGQVRTPGAYVIPGEEELTLPQAIAMAGGNTDIGDVRNVVVTRRDGSGTQKIKLNALSPSSADFLIREGDTILVKETLF